MTLTSNQLSASTSRRTRLVEICAAFPEIGIEPGGDGHLAFRIRKKTFAYYLFDHHGDRMIAFCCKSSLSEQHRLVKDDPVSFFVPAYLGSKAGWRFAWIWTKWIGTLSRNWPAALIRMSRPENWRPQLSSRSNR